MTRWHFDSSAGSLRGASDAHEYRVLGWPLLMGYRRPSGADAWRAWQPEFPVAGDGHGDPAIDAFLATIPEIVRRSAGRFQDHRWQVIRWCGLAGYGGEHLLEANPALAYMLALSPRCGRPTRAGKPAALPAALAFTRQRRLLGWLGFPATEAVRHVLARIEPAAVNVPAMLTLRKALTGVELPPRLAHAARINADVLLLAGHRLLDTVSAAIFEAVSETEGAASPSWFARQIVSTAAMWNRLRPGSPRPVFQSRESVRVLRRELTAEQRARRAEAPVGAFPAPPIPGTPAIQPVTNREMLDDEGQQQRNCLATYWKRAKAGRVAVYRVLEPERCTLSLVKRQGRWVIGELEAANNERARPETRAAVLAWLKSERKAAGTAPSPPAAPPSPA